jgi:hypothetical protein
MNDYQVTYSDGTIVEISAWTAEIARAIAEEEAEGSGGSGLAVVAVELLETEQAGT